MFAHPHSILSQFDIQTGHHVADFGAGTGFYSLAAAHLVGQTGRVFAIEVQKELLDRLKNEAHRKNLHNMEVVWGDIEHVGGTRLRDESIDRVIVSNTMFQVEDKNGVFSESFRILKRGGKLLLIDWSDNSSLSGPDASHLYKESKAIEDASERGFSFEMKIHAGAHHYGLIFYK